MSPNFLARAARATLLWAISLVVALAGGELVLRVWPQLIPLTALARFDSTQRTRIAIRLGLPNATQIYELPRDDGGPPLWLFRPNSRLTSRDSAGKAATVFLDAQGFCNPEPSAYRAETIDLIAAGDSFTWCQALPPEVIWSSEVSRRLGRSSYNLGRGGVGLYEYVQILKRFGLPKRPRVVILNVYEGNDLRDALRHARYSAGHARFRSIEPASNRSPAGSRLYRSSYLFNLIRSALSQPKASIEEPGNSPNDRNSRPNFRYRLRFGPKEIPFNLKNADSDEASVALALRNGSIGLDLFDGALASFVRLAREHGFAPVVSYSASAHTAYAEFVQFADPAMAGLMARFSQDQRRYFADRGRDLGYVFIDETPALQAAAKDLGPDRLLYFSHNLHFTPEGHRVVGELLARELAPLFGEIPAVEAPTEKSP